MRGGRGAQAAQGSKGRRVGLVDRILGRRRDQALPLYNAAVARARQEHWYVEGAVPDTVDGRFDTIAAVLSMVLLRLEEEPAGAAPAAHLTERFVDDMDQQLREIGIGDITVGKHIGKLMAALGGRLGAYRDALAAGDLGPALIKNLYRGEAPAPEALEHVAGALSAFRSHLSAVPIARLLEGDLP
ncbi:ubiquinol-cytochrome C chaperone family protein [Sphingomonas aerophila]|uniref:ubiquinol-cytochrome C chaperone family protein n=1 Tax=Sphingomonas aerophila TaxID=1344948 RepID=UPI00161BDD89|nr:ubiquinol-cytochrome C chaperone family protein [Sphingomonas aerophila]